MGGEIALIAVMLLFSAFFSGMEIAFLGRNRLREEIDRKQNPMFNYIADKFSRNPSNYITTILVGNNIALVIYSMSMATLMVELFNMDNELLQTIVSTIVILFIGEYIPKSVVRRNPNFYYTVLAPVILTSAEISSVRISSLPRSIQRTVSGTAMVPLERFFLTVRSLNTAYP